LYQYQFEPALEPELVAALEFGPRLECELGIVLVVDGDFGVMREYLLKYSLYYNHTLHILHTFSPCNGTYIYILCIYISS